ncbi:toxin-antitoxin system, toxin component [Streptomyces sp. DSM 40907]|uniref:toxin-antitoxin system, toxin component n=1 Tax=Streptomyces kutzneri TaxID=3051179 RepID=UPI0028D69504|nr:toxin-antitoxin system, toxin component [Streptomyces sp. DSM 40907]
MRRLSAQIVRNLTPPADGDHVIPSIAEALSRLRGRPVRLRKVPFPPATASGLWIDRTSRDLIVYEENTNPEHQLVIIGHEAWHMFQGHCRSGLEHDPAASRAGQGGTQGALDAFTALVTEMDDTEPPLGARTDVAIHCASRAETQDMREELEAERFGIRFATDVQEALEGAFSHADPQHLAGRIQLSMTHRFTRI